MPLWLVEDPTIVYVILGILGLGLGVMAWRTRKRKYGVAVGVVLLLICLVWLLDFLIVTDREQIQLNLQDMVLAAEQRNMDRLFTHISNDFRRGGMDKAAFRRAADTTIQRWNVRNIRLWDLDIGEVSRERRTAHVEFRARANGDWPGGGYAQCFCRSEFVLDSDGQWRMRTFELFNAVDTRDPLSIPEIGR